jgi:hypothetical protein
LIRNSAVDGVLLFAGFTGSVPLQQSERDEGVETIIRSARMQTQGVLQFEARFGTVRKQGESPSSTALNNVLLGQNPKPICNMWSGEISFCI